MHAHDYGGAGRPRWPPSCAGRSTTGSARTWLDPEPRLLELDLRAVRALRAGGGRDRAARRRRPLRAGAAARHRRAAASGQPQVLADLRGRRRRPACRSRSTPAASRCTAAPGWPSYYLEDARLERQQDGTQRHEPRSARACSTEFPGLQVVLEEGGITWAEPAAVVDRRRAGRASAGTSCRASSAQPSEYFREHFWFTTQPIEEPDDPQHLGPGPGAPRHGRPDHVRHRLPALGLRLPEPDAAAAARRRAQGRRSWPATRAGCTGSRDA